MSLPAGAARHAQVLRLQPGHTVTLFDGLGGEWTAQITRMGRSDVDVEVLSHADTEREADRPVVLATGLMAADRMEWLVEKATELGATQFQPLLTERSTLRLDSSRAERKRAHWAAVASAACEQCGRNRIPAVLAQQSLKAFLDPLAAADGARWVLSFEADATPLHQMQRSLAASQAVTLLSGPEGGLSPTEETAARAAGFQPVSLGTRVLRAETAPLAALAALTLV